MGSHVFVVDGESGLRPLRRVEFPTEKQLDGYIERYPDLLASALSSDERELRFILVETQAPIDDPESRSGRWAADALFLDQYGVLTIVEDKLSGNPEIRRKIIGQMIEYAANLLETLTVDGLQQRLARTYGDDTQIVAGLLADDEPDENAETNFWTNVERNLQAGLLRMVFVSNHLPSELRRTIEFLNRYMGPMEVLGVEIDRRGDAEKPEGPEVLVTSTVGEIVKKSKPPGTGSRGKAPLSNEDFLNDFRSAPDSSPEGMVAKRIIEILAECNDVALKCHRTPGGDSYCTVEDKRGHRPLLNAATKDGRTKCQINLGKKRNLGPILKELAGYELPIDDAIDSWCAKNESNMTNFIKWIKDAAAKA